VVLLNGKVRGAMKMDSILINSPVRVSYKPFTNVNGSGMPENGQRKHPTNDPVANWNKEQRTEFQRKST
jgi:hypothetical protein